jgi:hypothetical protein
VPGKQLELAEGTGIVLTPASEQKKVTIGASLATSASPGIVKLTNTLDGDETDAAPSVAAVNAALGDVEAALDAINGETGEADGP